MGLSHSPRMVTNGLVLCLDAGNTRSYPGTGTTWTDLFGSGNNGTLTNGPTFSSSNGGSVVFDGVNDYIVFGDVFDLGTNDLTINVWVRPTTLTNGVYYTILSKALAGAGARYSVGFANNNLWALFDGNTLTPVDVYSTSTFNTNTWYMLTFVFTRTSSISVYVNTVQQTFSTSSTISQWNGVNIQSTIPFRVGMYTASDNSGLSAPFLGNIASVQMYFRSLSAAEIRQNFNATRGRYGI